MRVGENVEINRPVEEGFTYVSDPQTLPEWSGVVKEVRSEAQGTLREGDRYTSVAKFLGRTFETPLEVTAQEPPRRQSARSTGGPFPQEYTYILEEAAGDGTRLTLVAEREPGGFFRLVGPLLQRAGSKGRVTVAVGDTVGVVEAWCPLDVKGGRYAGTK